MVDSHSETQLRAAIEDFFFGFRAFTAGPDALLAERGLSRAHHRILYFVSRHPGISVTRLLRILGVTKQAANGPLRTLERQGLIEGEPSSDDRRVRCLHVTDDGAALEAALSGVQLRLLADAFAAAGPDAEAGWRRVMGVLGAGRPGGLSG